MDLFNPDATTPTQPSETLDRHDLARLRRKFADATRVDRKRIKAELTTVMVSRGESTDNSTNIGSRVPRDVVSRLEHAATRYDTSVSALIRDAVQHYLTHELPKRRQPHAPPTPEEHD